MKLAWHPPDESMAASALAVFVEWARATGAMPLADPDQVMTWAARRGADFDAAMARFMGWPWPSPAASALVARTRGAREAVARHRGGVRDSWTYDALAPWIAAALDGADPIALAVFHLLERNTRPDDRLLWMGDPADPLPLGALFIGATVILADRPTSTLAEAERALELRRV
jgi:hypothetical protein